MISRVCGLAGIGCIMLLLSACDGNMGPGGNSSSSTATRCIDATTQEKMDKIEQDIDAGASDEEERGEFEDLGDTIDLLPIMGADGRCAVNPDAWARDCAQEPFQTMRHSRLVCRSIAGGIELVRPTDPAGGLRDENIILVVHVRNGSWNGAERAVERVGDDSVSRISLFTIVTTETENEDGTTTTEERCERDDRHIEVRGNFSFEKVVEFVAQTLEVSQPCTP